MNLIKKWTRRLIMVVLFGAALFTTFQSISGVEAQSIVSYISMDGEDESQSEGSYINHKMKSMAVAFKSLLKAASYDTLISSSQEVTGNAPTLEETFNYSKYPKMTVQATGYTAGYESTGKNPGHPEFGITYSGVKVKRDLYSTVAADLNVFPIGTVLFIPGYGYGVVADKGGAIEGNELDLYYETVDDVYEQWGKKTLEVYIVEKGKGTLTESDLKKMNENESMQVFRQQYTGSGRE